MRFRTSSPRRGGEIAGLRLSLLLVAASVLAAPAPRRVDRRTRAAAVADPARPRTGGTSTSRPRRSIPASTAFVDWIGAVPLHPDFGGNNGAVAVYGMPYSTVSSGQAKKAVNFQYWDESDGVDDATTKGIPFYPIPDEAITQSHWIEGGQAGNATVGGDRHMLILDTGQPDPLRALPAQVGRGEHTLERRLGRGVGPHEERPAAEDVDVRRRGRARDLSGPRAVRRGLRSGRDRARIPRDVERLERLRLSRLARWRARTRRRRRWGRGCA